MPGYAIPIQSGYGYPVIPVYSGDRRQVGGSIWATLKRFAMPIFKALIPQFKKYGQKIGQSVLNVGAHTAADLLDGNIKEIPQNLKKRALNEVKSLGSQVVGDVLNHVGSGAKRRKITKIHKKQQKKKKKKAKAKKRKKSSGAAARPKDIFD